MENETTTNETETGREVSKLAPKRTADQRRIDAHEIMRQVVRGLPHHEIAIHISSIRPYSLSRQMISYEVGKMRKEWKDGAAEMMASQKETELMGLAEQERELWAAWEKSKTDATRSRVEKRDGGEGGRGGSLQAISKEGQNGDPAYQRLILDIRDRRAKLLGLDAPVRSEVSGPDGGPITNRTLPFDAGQIEEALRQKFLAEQEAASGPK